MYSINAYYVIVPGMSLIKLFFIKAEKMMINKNYRELEEIFDQLLFQQEEYPYNTFSHTLFWLYILGFFLYYVNI